MKTSWRHDIMPYLVFAIGVSAFGASAAESPQTNAQPGLDMTGVVWGEETNGVRAGIQLSPTPPFTVTIWLQLEPDIPANPSVSETNLATIMWIGGSYFKATNSFCGPMELRDSSGRKLPLLQSHINSRNAYPSSISLVDVRAQFMSQYSVYHGPPLPPISLGAGVGPLPMFSVTNYFKIPKPGDYSLTIWPKIYKRAFANADLCRRVDVPPVTVSIKWSSKP